MGSLRGQAQAWGFELHAAGVNVNLAPVMDVVPDAVAASNAPIGAFDRQLGQDLADVAEQGFAFMAGMDSAGVSSTIKHFPGLGRASGNPDNSSEVTDDVTSHGPWVHGPWVHGPSSRIRCRRYRTADPGTFAHLVSSTARRAPLAPEPPARPDTRVACPLPAYQPGE